MAMVAIGATATLILFWLPATRRIMFWILPLGRGVDDAIVLAAMIIAGVFWLFHFVRQRRNR
jgi:pilus assembly protein TadC